MVAKKTKDSKYVEKLLPRGEEFFCELEKYAIENKVPIIDKISLDFLLKLLKIKKAKNVLEIGTAIAYSTINICEKVGCKIISLERDEKMYNIAKENVKKRNLEEKITLLKQDALFLTEEVKENAPYDAVFLDGAKAQNKKFFELYEPFFAEDVIIVTDNVLFKGMVADPSIIKHSRDLKQLSRKINDYNEWLMNNKNYETTILPFSDGIAITIRKK